MYVKHRIRKAIIFVTAVTAFQFGCLYVYNMSLIFASAILMFSLDMYQYPGTIVRMELCVCVCCMNNVLAMNNINTDHPEVLVHNVCGV